MPSSSSPEPLPSPRLRVICHLIGTFLISPLEMPSSSGDWLYQTIECLTFIVILIVIYFIMYQFKYTHNYHHVCFSYCHDELGYFWCFSVEYQIRLPVVDRPLCDPWSCMTLFPSFSSISVVILLWVIISSMILAGLFLSIWSL